MFKHIVIAAGLLAAGAASAQDRLQRTPEEMAKARTERLTTVLELTPEQSAQVQALHLRHAQEWEARRTQLKADREARRAQMEEKRAGHEAEMKSILTPEQFAKWQAMREQRAEREHGRRQKQEPPVR